MPPLSRDELGRLQRDLAGQYFDLMTAKEDDVGPLRDSLLEELEGLTGGLATKLDTTGVGKGNNPFGNSQLSLILAQAGEAILGAGAPRSPLRGVSQVLGYDAGRDIAATATEQVLQDVPFEKINFSGLAPGQITEIVGLREKAVKSKFAIFDSVIDKTTKLQELGYNIPEAQKRLIASRIAQNFVSSISSLQPGPDPVDPLAIYRAKKEIDEEFKLREEDFSKAELKRWEDAVAAAVGVLGDTAEAKEIEIYAIDSLIAAGDLNLATRLTQELAPDAGPRPGASLRTPANGEGSKDTGRSGSTRTGTTAVDENDPQAVLDDILSKGGVDVPKDIQAAIEETLSVAIPDTNSGVGTEALRSALSNKNRNNETVADMIRAMIAQRDTTAVPSREAILRYLKKYENDRILKLLPSAPSRSPYGR